VLPDPHIEDPVVRDAIAKLCGADLRAFAGDATAEAKYYGLDVKAPAVEGL
jgi:hypothetical protein